MFEKKDIIFSETIGVCQVHDVTKLTDDHGHTINYYVLKNVFDKSKVAYIPVEGHQVVLRYLLTEIQAREMYEKAKEEGKVKELSDLSLEEIAYLLKVKKTDLLPEEEE